MKNIKLTIKLVAVAIAVLISFSRCTDFGEVNIDPNKVSEAHPQLLLTNTTWQLFAKISKNSMYATRVLVQSDGESSEQYYKWNRSSFDSYEKLRDVVKMKEEAEKIDAKEYVALSYFFKSLYFYDLTLTFGDIPYSEALQGETNQQFMPKYDTQEVVFKGILEDLKKANDLLSKVDDKILGDIIFDGEARKWQKVVNSFRLKVLMTLSKRESAFNAKSQFVSIMNSLPIITSNEDNFQVKYLDKQDNRYPLFNDSGFGSGMYMDSTFVSLLALREDARLLVFCTQTKNAKDAGLPINDYSSYDGGDPIKPYATANQKAVAGEMSKPHPRFYSSPTNEPKVFLGYSEVEFIIAEAILRGWVNGNAKEHYDNAIKASFEFYNANVGGYDAYLNSQEAEKYVASGLVNFSNAKSKSEKLEMILTQKYIATIYFQGTWRAYFDYLRTGYPEFRLSAGMKVPTRWMYPQSEYNDNADNVSEAIQKQFGGNDNIYGTMWWLKQ